MSIVISHVGEYSGGVEASAANDALATAPAVRPVRPVGALRPVRRRPPLHLRHRVDVSGLVLLRARNRPSPHAHRTPTKIANVGLVADLLRKILS